MADASPKRHVFIPDTQIKPGVPLDHLDWASKWIVAHKCSSLIIAGDWHDFPSLNSHEEKGSQPLEGLRFQTDLACGNEAFARFCAPIEAEQARLIRNKERAWRVHKIAMKGNHEIRADRVASNDPRLIGTIGSHLCDFRDFEVHEFLKVIDEDGVLYSHYYKAHNSGNAIGGSADNMLNKIGRSHVQGHRVGFQYGNRPYPDGTMRHSVVAGSFYLHFEDYRTSQSNTHFRGIVVLNEVNNGDFCIMPLSCDFLCRYATGKPLKQYMAEAYPHGDWSHL